MSRELTLIERMKVEFGERDGLLYPYIYGARAEYADTVKSCIDHCNGV